MASLTLGAPVKVNLHLGIYPGRGERGYHRADSVMVPLGIGDRVTVTEVPRTSPKAQDAPGGVLLRMSDDVGVPYQRNTAWLAVARMLDEFGIDGCFEVTVEKRVPPQSGLGGSSSDAASVILALCRLVGVETSDERAVRVARSVGADVPFFLDTLPSYLTGAGDVLSEVFPALEGVAVALVRPSAGVSTARAYREFDADPIEPASPEPMLSALRAGDARAVAATLYNNLAPAAQRIVPEVSRVLDWLGAQPGVMGAQVTGSGSCCFALCESEARSDAIASLARDTKDWWASSTKTVGKDAQFC